MRDNVEFHFASAGRKAAAKSTAAKPQQKKRLATSVDASAADKKAVAAPAKAERRRKLAGEFAKWERQVDERLAANGSESRAR